MNQEHEISEALREHVQRELAKVDFANFSDRVLQRIAGERPVPWREKARVWLREALAFHPVRMALAAAAAVALFVGTPAMLFGRAPGNATVVRALEFGANGGTVYQGGGDMTIIWIGEGG